MQRKASVLWGEKKVVLRQTPRAVTPFGGLSVFIEFLKRVGFPERVRQDLPFSLRSPNAIPAGETLTAFLIAVVAGAASSADRYSGAAELLAQPNAFYRSNGYAVLIALVLLYAWPLATWRLQASNQSGQSAVVGGSV